MPILAGLQAVAGPPAPTVAHPIAVIPKCPASSDPDDVVVCADDRDRYRLKPLPPPRVAGPALPKAETRIGNAKVAAEAEAASVGGFTSNRAMVRLKIPF